MKFYNQKKDQNHVEISNCFYRLGYSVVDLSRVGGGCPDLLVAKRNSNFLVEIKIEKGLLNIKQKKFARKWNGPPIVVARTIDDVLMFDKQFTKEN